MIQGFTHLHNALRWVVIIFAIYAIIQLLSGKNQNRPFTNKDRRPVLLYMIFLDIQLLLGAALFFMGNWGLNNIKNAGMGTVMKNDVSRFFAIEHTIGMLLAIILAHIAHAFTKKDMSDQDKFSKTLYLVAASIVVILMFIPWPFRDAARPLFPGMNVN
ncbi:MAG TPA: hypothetical protein VK027_02055 [Chitinophagaceae bacterium]|nr:hypothetical protein [Chitinophagaceae bacterium]